jgi:molybdenum cofactor synthesis domain-containing protein
MNEKTMQIEMPSEASPTPASPTLTSLNSRASILAVGTELTTGQITNRNAATISERLVQLGIEVVLHETVPDDRDAIKQALERCWATSRLVFVCGGLGPTTDDFTRDVIADWLKCPLEYYEPSWIKIQERLKKFGIPVAPSNEQQAYYPQGADVLKNAQGTADGFSCRIQRDQNMGRMWVLPGPPREIDAIWQDNDLTALIKKELPEGIEPLKLFTWECLGKSEAELGEITEAAIQGSGLQTGYRAHRPYVEVKLWVPESKISENQTWIDKLDAAIATWTVARNGEDLGKQLVALLKRAEAIDIVDSCSAGFLMERLGPIFRSEEGQEVAKNLTVAMEWQSTESPGAWISKVLSEADDSVLTLAIAGITPTGEWAMGLRENGRSLQKVLQSPWKDAALMERSRTYIVEFALKKWRDWLNQSSH